MRDQTMRRQRRRFGKWGIVAVAWVAGCTGIIGAGPGENGGPGGPGTLNCEVPNPGASEIRRLNKAEYSYTLLDLFGHQDAGAELPAENVVDGYDNNIGNTSVSQLRADKMFAAIETVGAATVTDLNALLPCDASAIDDACVDEFIRTVGRRAYRHELDSKEREILRTVYDTDPSWTQEDRIRLVLQAMLMAPQFVYRPEIGTPPAEGESKVRALTGYEVATRMAYLLWASTPDDALLDAAAAGDLDNVEGIAVQAERLLAHARARRGILNFLTQWVDLRGLDLVNRDATAYPNFSTAATDSMREETRRFLERVVVDDGGGIAELLTSNETSVDATLADIYGISHPGDGSWIPAVLDETTRSGILTQAGFLTNKAHSIAPAPVQRGIFVRTRLLCQDIPDPPDDIDISPKPQVPTNTNRELLSQHSSDPKCVACHRLMDPIGFGFENFDSTGFYRTTEGENDLPIDASGELIATEDIDGPFDGAVELASRLATSAEVNACMANQTFRYAFGRRPVAEDQCSVDQLDVSAETSGGSILELLVAMTVTDGFRFRTFEETE